MTRVNTINKIIHIVLCYSLLLSTVLLIGIVLPGAAKAQQSSGVQECAVQTTTQEATAFFTIGDGAIFASPSNTVQITAMMPQSVDNCVCLSLSSFSVEPLQRKDDSAIHSEVGVKEQTGLCKP
jgi:energy-converting hydrogenase Eha subunit F